MLCKFSDKVVVRLCVGPRAVCVCVWTNYTYTILNREQKSAGADTATQNQTTEHNSTNNPLNSRVHANTCGPVGKPPCVCLITAWTTTRSANIHRLHAWLDAYDDDDDDDECNVVRLLYCWGDEDPYYTRSDRLHICARFDLSITSSKLFQLTPLQCWKS